MFMMSENFRLGKYIKPNSVYNKHTKSVNELQYIEGIKR